MTYRFVAALFVFSSLTLTAASAKTIRCWKEESGRSRIVMINGGEVINKFGQAATATLNQRLISYADKLGADLVVQQAVYVGAGFNRTDEFIEFYGSQGSGEGLKKLLPASVGFISTESLFKSSVFSRLRATLSDSEARNTFVGLANEAIKSVADSEKISFVFQTAVWASPACDMTEMVSQAISSSVR